MKRVLMMLVFGGALVAAARAEFLRQLPADKFSAAGLNKLTPQELAALEQLIAEHERGAVTAAATKSVPVAAEPATAAEKKKSGPGWLRALLTLQETQEKPETAEAVETRLAGDYDGWTGHTVFKLENGQVWQQAGGGERYDDKRHAPTVKIYPGILGVYWLEIEGVRERVKVKPLKLK